MAPVKSPPDFVERLKDALVQTLRANGIPAKVAAEQVPTTKLYRIQVLAPKFKHMMHSERQSLVWRIAEQALSQEEMMRISTILTLEPSRIRGK